MRAFGDNIQLAREEHTAICDELFELMIAGLEHSDNYKDLLEAAQQLEREYNF